MDKWFDLCEKPPRISGEYRVILKGIDGQPDKETTAYCEVMFNGTVHRWTRHGVLEDRVMRWKPINQLFVDDYSYGEKPTKDQLENALEVLKCERLARWQSMMSEQEKYEIEQAHNLCIYLLKEALT